MTAAYRTAASGSLDLNGAARADAITTVAEAKAYVAALRREYGLPVDSGAGDEPTRADAASQLDAAEARAAFMRRMDAVGRDPLPKPIADDDTGGRAAPVRADAATARAEFERRMASLGTAPIIHAESFDG